MKKQKKTWMPRQHFIYRHAQHIHGYSGHAELEGGGEADACVVPSPLHRSPPFLFCSMVSVVSKVPSSPPPLPFGIVGCWVVVVGWRSRGPGGDDHWRTKNLLFSQNKACLFSFWKKNKIGKFFYWKPFFFVVCFKFSCFHFCKPWPTGRERAEIDFTLPLVFINIVSQKKAGWPGKIATRRSDSPMNCKEY